MLPVIFFYCFLYFVLLFFLTKKAFAMGEGKKGPPTIGIYHNFKPQYVGKRPPKIVTPEIQAAHLKKLLGEYFSDETFFVFVLKSSNTDIFYKIFYFTVSCTTCSTKKNKSTFYFGSIICGPKKTKIIEIC